VAFIDEKPVSTGCCSINGEVGRLYGAVTLPEYRSRGCYQSVLSSRLRRARDLGATIALTEDDPDVWRILMKRASQFMARKAVIALRFVDCVRADFTVRDRGEIGLGARSSSARSLPDRVAGCSDMERFTAIGGRCPRSSSGEFVRGLFVLANETCTLALGNDQRRHEDCEVNCCFQPDAVVLGTRKRLLQRSSDREVRCLYASAKNHLMKLRVFPSMVVLT